MKFQKDHENDHDINGHHMWIKQGTSRSLDPQFQIMDPS